MPSSLLQAHPPKLPHQPLLSDQQFSNLPANAPVVSPGKSGASTKQYQHHLVYLRHVKHTLLSSCTPYLPPLLLSPLPAPLFPSYLPWLPHPLVQVRHVPQLQFQLTLLILLSTVLLLKLPRQPPETNELPPPDPDALLLLIIQPPKLVALCCCSPKGCTCLYDATNW